MIKWKKPLPRKYDSLDDSVRQNMYIHEINLWGYFVEGAPVLLSCNIKSVRKLVNGSPGLLHNLTFEGPPPPTVTAAFERGTFTIVEIDTMPKSVNIRVGSTPCNPYLWHQTPLVDLSSLVTSVIDNAQTIPLVLSSPSTFFYLKGG